MKSNLLRIFLEWALITSLLMSVGFFYWFYSASKALRICDMQIAIAQNHLQSVQASLNMLGQECDVYARTNADLARLLESLKPRQQASPAPATATKPASK